jgi:hypothetical protein
MVPHHLGCLDSVTHVHDTLLTLCIINVDDCIQTDDHPPHQPDILQLFSHGLFC